MLRWLLREIVLVHNDEGFAGAAAAYGSDASALACPARISTDDYNVA
jgi:hypothetical protein